LKSYRFILKQGNIKLVLENEQLTVMKFGSQTEVEEVVLEDVKDVESKKLILFNDEVNTFDFVIESLIKVCGHEPMQAEQCTIIVHYKGKCDVKGGEWDSLEPLCTALLDRGLTAQIQ
jgi:ATP-dependent Clp protease adaptor protein ClpS